MGEAAFQFPEKFQIEVTEDRLSLHFFLLPMIPPDQMLIYDKINHFQQGLPPPIITEWYFTFTLCCTSTDILDFMAFINSAWAALEYEDKGYNPHFSIKNEEEKGDVTCSGHPVSRWQRCQEIPGPLPPFQHSPKGMLQGLGSQGLLGPRRPEGDAEDKAPCQDLRCSRSSVATSEESCRNTALLQDWEAKRQRLLAIGHGEG